MVVRYEITPAATTAAYWYRWRASARFKLGVLLCGLVPATFTFTMMSTLFRGPSLVPLAMALIAMLLSPLLFSAVLYHASRRGTRTLSIDASGLTTEVANGQWEAPWSDVREIALTPTFLFILGRGMNSISVPVSAFADEAERDEFVRRAERYWEAARS